MGDFILCVQLSNIILPKSQRKTLIEIDRIKEGDSARSLLGKIIFAKISINNKIKIIVCQHKQKTTNIT